MKSIASTIILAVTFSLGFAAGCGQEESEDTVFDALEDATCDELAEIVADSDLEEVNETVEAAAETFAAECDPGFRAVHLEKRGGNCGKNQCAGSCIWCDGDGMPGNPISCWCEPCLKCAHEGF